MSHRIGMASDTTSQSGSRFGSSWWQLKPTIQPSGVIMGTVDSESVLTRGMCNCPTTTPPCGSHHLSSPIGVSRDAPCRQPKDKSRTDGEKQARYRMMNASGTTHSTLQGKHAGTGRSNRHTETTSFGTGSPAISSWLCTVEGAWVKD